MIRHPLICMSMYIISSRPSARLPIQHANFEASNSPNVGPRNWRVNLSSFRKNKKRRLCLCQLFQTMRQVMFTKIWNGCGLSLTSKVDLNWLKKQPGEPLIGSLSVVSHPRIVLYCLRSDPWVIPKRALSHQFCCIGTMSTLRVGDNPKDTTSKPRKNINYKYTVSLPLGRAAEKSDGRAHSFAPSAATPRQNWSVGDSIAVGSVWP